MNATDCRNEKDAATHAEEVAASFAIPKVAHKDCPRCAGQGYFAFNGRAPAVCFRCAGSGRVPANNAAAAVLKDAESAREAARLAALKAGLAAALAHLQAAPGFSARVAAKAIEARLARFSL